MSTVAAERLTLEASEFNRREGGGQQVRLLWIHDRNELLVEQLDKESGVITLRQVPSGEGNLAFEHPSDYEEITLDYDYQVVAGEIELPRVS